RRDGAVRPGQLRLFAHGRPRAGAAGTEGVFRARAGVERAAAPPHRPAAPAPRAAARHRLLPVRQGPSRYAWHPRRASRTGCAGGAGRPKPGGSGGADPRRDPAAAGRPLMRAVLAFVAAAGLLAGCSVTDAALPGGAPSGPSYRVTAE